MRSSHLPTLSVVDFTSLAGGMSSIDSNIDEYTLLCERCGYVVEGLPTSGTCPECGKAIEESLPARRVGSRCQSQPGRRAIWLTNIQTLRHPVRTFDALRIQRSSGTTLLLKNLVLASVLPSMAAAMVFVVAQSLQRFMSNESPGLIGVVAGTLIFWLLVVSIVTVLLVEILVVLTRIEQMGIRFFGGRRGWRITPDVAFVVCAHASVGWIIGGAVMGLGLLGVFGITVVYEATHAWQPYSGAGQILKWIVPISALCGLLAFESLVFIGVRRCKFANRTKPSEPAVFRPLQRGGFRGKEVRTTDVA